MEQSTGKVPTFCHNVEFWELTFWEVDILGVDISRVDIVGVDTLGVDTLGRTPFEHFFGSTTLF